MRSSLPLVIGCISLVLALFVTAVLGLALLGSLPPAWSVEAPGVATSSPDATATTRAATRNMPFAGTGGAPAEQLDVLAEDDAAPWSCQDGTGYANDVVRAAFRAAGVDVRLLVVPYARGKNMTIAGEAVACFSMSWLSEFEGKIVFADKPLFQCYADYFHRLDRPLAARSEGEIDTKIVVGAVVGYEYPPSLYRLRDKGLVVIDESPSEELNLRKLAAGRLDAAIVTWNETKTAEYMQAKAGVGDKVARAFRSGVLGSYIGFSTKHPRGAWAADKFNAGFQVIASDGTLRRIEEQWSRRTKAETERLLRPAATP